MAEQVDRAHVRRLSICQPLHDGVFRPLHDDGLFEQSIVRRKELNLCQSVFSTYPDLQEFQTKNLHRKHPTKPGFRDCCGRADIVIVFSNAEDLNLVDFKSAASSHPVVRTALVGEHGKFQTCLLIEPMTAAATAIE